jgi:hypothetical protein
MARANVNDRESLQGAYPAAAFQEDAANNAVGDAQVIRGVRIESAPDGDGWFQLSRAKQHVGESADAAGSCFLAPSEPHIMASLVGAEAEDGAPQGEALVAARRQEYEVFIDRLAEAARSANFPAPIGQGEERLKGFRGG